MTSSIHCIRYYFVLKIFCSNIFYFEINLTIKWLLYNIFIIVWYYNNLTNYRRRHSKLLYQLSCFVGHPVLQISNHNLLCSLDPLNQGRLFWVLGPVNNNEYNWIIHQIHICFGNDWKVRVCIIYVKCMFGLSTIHIIYI